MRRFDFPTAPVVVGMILGPLAEAQMRNAMSIGEGKWSVFVERPMSLVLLVVVVAVLVLPRCGLRKALRPRARAAAELSLRAHRQARVALALHTARASVACRVLGQPCRWRIAIAASAAIHSCWSFRQAM